MMRREGLAWPLVALSLLMVVGANPSVAAPDEDSLGKAEGYPVAPSIAESRKERYRVGSFSALDTLAPSCTLAPAPVPLALPTGTPTKFSYRFSDKTYTLDDYMQRQRATAVLVLHDGKIVAERYGYDRTAAMRMLSNSMAKTITALGLVKALEEGLIRSSHLGAERDALFRGIVAAYGRW